ncbi:MAG: multifunctional oxoglutarate decarboxylase/oxoglutarate dehydrogenase thiamine pyrophosphate-binding subunit/dihydrolipoyllysine-residue succinyltransferase subunit [Actinobacteria bacterium]|nr:multifunctional oxoglutarate decarboxylase/oxoglutarate dehydrogenase thiamine pyrophosphate-binding subunit/dihydrolipoyllysine-residue succinyltransferase subunit [Actinomycetota bacterium]
MYRQYQENPKSVGESWQEFFEDYRPSQAAANGRTSAPERPRPEPATEAAAEPAQPLPVPKVDAEVPEDADALTGIAAKIAENMETSLGVPTATSVRRMPAKLLEENRRIINRYLASSRGGKVSFTHIIGWAILKGIEARSGMKSVFAEVDGKPHVIRHKHVNFGLAVDMERRDGRVLVVPNIKSAHELDFAGFFSAYEDLIRKVRANKLELDDFAGTTVTLTNPGTVGTSMSVPRLMAGQGLIVGVGAVAYPTEYEGSDPATLARLGVSKIITMTSTYDHRVIQGAESGEFLAAVHKLLLGEDRFYDEIFASLRIPYEPVRWSVDRSPVDDIDGQLEKQSRVIRLVNMYRVRGHLIAELNPIGWEVLSHPELDLANYGLTVWDLDREFLTYGVAGPRKQTLREIVDKLRDSYSRKIGYEFMHISDPLQKEWIQQRAEGHRTLLELSKDDKKYILDRLNAAEAFERFLSTKYTGQKRFSLEGAESLIPMLDYLFELAADEGMVEAVMGMSHRGRLNVLANIVGKSFNDIFSEFDGYVDPETVQGSGDVKYHLGMTGAFTSRAGGQLGVVLASNPSHLEAVDPVVAGMARAKQDLVLEDGHRRILPVLLHGDAAFAGQGVVAETLSMSQLKGYRTGGTIHIVINNNIGFTTSPVAGRSSTYATDIAKMIQCPIFHVNADDPEACVKVMKLAYDYRREFKSDVVVDLVCYRRHGHNEADEPAFTQPLMYSRIQEHRSVRKLYTEQLLNHGELTVEEAEASFENFRSRMQSAFDDTKGSAPREDFEAKEPELGKVMEPFETGVSRERLDIIWNKLTSFPDGFEPHPKLKKMIEKRSDALSDGAIDWAGAEALSWGSLLLEGVTVRLSGQDSRRGTFSQRHSVLVDHRTEQEYTPLNDLSEDQAPFRAFDSPLSEFAAMGFEYGYSVANGDALVQWEAQFGDFVNGAQVIIDQFVVAGQDKWNQDSSVVLLLPHGFEGQGPEHSSARLERFLTLSAEGGIQVAQPTTAAQYFHLLRRQAHPSVRVPLVIITPKSLLRHPAARSSVSELESGRFEETIDDASGADPESVERVLLCTGKVSVALKEMRDEKKSPAAVVRVEQLYPFPDKQLLDIFERYPNLKEVRWIQEEPENMGAWHFIFNLLSRVLPENIRLIHAARPESASPASGSTKMHELEHRRLLEKAFS